MRWRLFASSLLAAQASGCAALLPHAIPVPPDLQSDGDTYQVSGGVNAFQHHIYFGPYRVSDAYASGLSTDSTTPRMWNGRTERTTSEQSASFDFLGAAGTAYRAECWHTKLIVTQPDPSSPGDEDGDFAGKTVLKYENKFRCTLKRKDGAPIKLKIDDGSQGTARDGELALKIESVNDDGRTRYDSEDGAPGYLVWDDEVRALVDVTPRHSVSLSRKLSPEARDKVAAVAAALLVMSEMYD